KLTGGCLCGAIRYEARGPRRNSFICHCRMCQRASGAPFAGLFYMATENLQITKGAPLTYKSSPQVERAFCGVCGAPLFFSRLSRPEQRAVTVGSLDDPNHFEPTFQVCLSSAVSWLDRCKFLPGYEEKPEGMTPTLSYDPVTGKTAERPARG